MTDSTAASEPAAMVEAERARLNALADVLITGDDAFPSPTEIDLGHAWIDRALAAMPSMTTVVTSVVRDEGEPAELINRLESSDAERFGAFSLIVSGAYLMHPKVRTLLGYPGHAPKENPAVEGEWEFYLEDDILKPVLDRGQFFREAPTLSDGDR